MINETHILELEEALLARAKALAEEYHEHGQRSRERIIQNANEKLRLREEREMLVAKALADRTYQQHVQAGELKLQARMDRLRWALVQGVLDQAKDKLARLVDDETRYLPVLGGLLAQAASGIERDELTAQMSVADHARLAKRWAQWSGEQVPEKSIELSAEPLQCSGGILVLSRDGRIRVDNTFEGRLERLGRDLEQVITERLFAGVADTGVSLGG